MIPILEDAILGSDLDCQNFTLSNIRTIYPIPPGLVAINDPRLDDPRVPPAASLTNEHFSATAEIDQFKLNLNAVIPGAWLGTGISQAAPGNLSERLSNKGAANGYAPVDADMKLPATSVAPGASLGTVNSVQIFLPPEFTHTPEVIETSGTFATSWAAAPDNSYLGIYGFIDLGGTLLPSFVTSQMPSEVIPSFDASKFTSGVFPLSCLPVATSMGAGHAPGLLPTPGELGDPNEYLGRDMEWHHFNADKNYQPTLASPSITLGTWSGESATVNISAVKGSVLFYRLASSASASFVMATGISVALSVPNGDFVEAYAAKTGYNNSRISTYIVVTPLSEVT
jgi:hypothetical protein